MIVSSVLIGLILLATQSTTTIQSADGLLLSSSSALSFVQRPIIQRVSPGAVVVVVVVETVDRKSCGRGRIIHRTTSLFESSGSGSGGGGGFGNEQNRRLQRLVNDDKNTLKQRQSSSSSTTELFEYQELRAQLTTMVRQNISYQTLTYEKSVELSDYVKTVVGQLDSPIDFTGGSSSSGSSGMGTAYFVAGLENKSWRMIFTTTAAATSASDDYKSSTSNSSSKNDDIELPYGSSIVLRIGSFMGTRGTLDYVIKWNNNGSNNNNKRKNNSPMMGGLGLKELVAKSSCSIDIGPISPGLLTYQYQDIKTNIFGLTNIPVGFFGLLKGRISYIDTVWFDGERWIERNYSTNGDVIYSVYVRDVDDEKNQERNIK